MNTIEDASIIGVLVIRVLFLPEHSYSTDHIPQKRYISPWVIFTTVQRVLDQNTPAGG